MLWSTTKQICYEMETVDQLIRFWLVQILSPILHSKYMKVTSKQLKQLHFSHQCLNDIYAEILPVAYSWVSPKKWY